MTPTKGYCTTTDLNSQFVLNNINVPALSTSTALSDMMDSIINAASRRIDLETGRYFYGSTADEVRYFTARDLERCFIGDFISITTLQTDSLQGDRSYPFTWATTDYDPWPYVSTAEAEQEPYRFLDKAPNGNYQFPKGLAKGVKVTGKFGWSAVPAAVSYASLLWSARLYMRFSAVLGVSSATPFGQQVSKVPLDPDIADMINNYRAPAV